MSGVFVQMGRPRPQVDDAARILDELMDAYARRVLAYAARRTPDLADAEDAAAETFTIAWRKIDQLPDDGQLSWLLAIARRVLANQRRASSRRAGLLAKLGRHSALDQVSPGDSGRDGPALVTLARMRPDDRELLRLVAWEELDQHAIARVLGISPNAVAIRLHRARKRFRDEFVKDSARGRTSTEAKGTNSGAMQERVE